MTESIPSNENANNTPVETMINRPEVVSTLDANSRVEASTSTLELDNSASTTPKVSDHNKYHTSPSSASPPTCTPIITLQNNIAIRPYLPTDADSLPQFCNYKIWINMRDIWPRPYTLAKAQEWVKLNTDPTAHPEFWQPVCSLEELIDLRSTILHAQTASDATTKPKTKLIPCHYVITQNSTFIGGCGFTFGSIQDVNLRSAEFGYWLGEKYWGQGIATLVVQALSAWAFDTFKYLVRLEAFVFAWNPASCRVLEKCGFVLEARKKRAVWKDGKETDLLIFAKLRPEENAEGQE